MKRVLSYGNKEAEPIYWDISNEVLFLKAIMELFALLDASWKVYDDLKDEEKKKVCEECDGNRNIKLKTGVYTCPKCDGYSMTSQDIKKIEKQRELYKLAKDGDAKSAFLLLKERKGPEYQEWHVYNVRS